jgi:hypothetical protein
MACGVSLGLLITDSVFADENPIGWGTTNTILSCGFTIAQGLGNSGALFTFSGALFCAASIAETTNAWLAYNKDPSEGGFSVVLSSFDMTFGCVMWYAGEALLE